MISLFLALGISYSVENRVFIQRNPNFTGSWEYSGNASYFGDIFYLTRDAPKVYGGIYHTSYLAENFSFEISIVFEGATESNPANAGIWITKDYHQQPIVFGGPLSFDGVGLMMVYNGSYLNTEFRKNDKRGRFTSFQYFPESFVKLENSSVKIRFEHRNGVCNVTFFTGNRTEKGFDDVALSSLKKYYLSITTKSGMEPNSVYVNSALVSDDPNDVFAPIVVQKVSWSDPELNQTRAVPSTKPPSPKAGANSATSAIDVLDELLDFGIQTKATLTKTSDVKILLWKEILPFSDRWQRRSIRINRQTGQLRENIKDTLEFSHKQFKLVNDDIIKDLNLIKGSINEISSELFYGINSNLELNNDIRNAKKEGLHNISEVLLYIGIVELCAVAVVIFIKLISEKIDFHA